MITSNLKNMENRQPSLQVCNVYLDILKAIFGTALIVQNLSSGKAIDI
jgi:hypothetical protein